jgi:hypothetical protein
MASEVTRMAMVRVPRRSLFLVPMDAYLGPSSSRVW